MWKSDPRVPLELQQGIWGFSQVAVGNSGFLLSCIRGLKTPLELRWELSVPLQLQCGTQGSTRGMAGNVGSSRVGGLLRVLLDLWWGLLSSFLGAIHL